MFYGYIRSVMQGGPNSRGALQKDSFNTEAQEPTCVGFMLAAGTYGAQYKRCQAPLTSIGLASFIFKALSFLFVFYYFIKHIKLTNPLIKCIFTALFLFLIAAGKPGWHSGRSI